MAPIMLGFVDNNSNVTNGGSYSVNVFDDSEANITVARSGNSLEFQGDIYDKANTENNSEYFKLSYNLTNKTFDYEQYLILVDSELVINGEDPPTSGDTVWLIYNTIKNISPVGEAFIGTNESYFLSFDYREGENSLDYVFVDGELPRVESQYIKGEFYMGNDYVGVVAYDSTHLLGMMEDAESTADIKALGWDPMDLSKSTDFISYLTRANESPNDFDAKWSPFSPDGTPSDANGFVLFKVDDLGFSATAGDYVEIDGGVPWINP